jgi:hypothetical protein
MTSNKRSENVKGALDGFESGGDLEPVEDRNRYDERLDSLPPREKELAQESARFADLCQYFERQRMDIPMEIVDQLGRASRLAIPEERIEAMKKLNQKLMEYLDNVGQGPGIRQ